MLVVSVVMVNCVVAVLVDEFISSISEASPTLVNDQLATASGYPGIPSLMHLHTIPKPCTQ